ncbi:2,5-diamino-6-(ribosylamino)-4(3H)-pyrimidinone 5'-phosphate reductase [Halocalculus aciditolerans]|uniref:2,5-diamino-6-(ribosylamino)-4(3H)-pyrimidinone 5'-phosphate reductase n=1 Tax=Halocalculus aciditolerans TaxID=1383812 RepID=A0A830FGS2_9EURY|nr:2,5-diamino-6-(ribosylamino)-4(3H)-pyrimidinone 5'-phosphate reductase [Halocalculus aciditolerans]GGL54293.1 diaminohydroxyphosphoribosylaminopyrimidine reductase [Halocalculus aciditolerans]
MFVHVNVAASADGKLSSRRREQIRISGSEDMTRVDRLRADSDAVMVGVGTVLADDPSLTVKDPALADEREADRKPRQPARVVADSHARTPPDADVLDDAARSFVLVAEEEPTEHVQSLAGVGAEIVVAGTNRVDLADAFDTLEGRGVDRLLVEGGGELIFSLFEEGLVDRFTLYVGSMVIGGRDAPTPADGDGFVERFPDLDLVDVERLDDGVLLTYDV